MVDGWRDNFIEVSCLIAEPRGFAGRGSCPVVLTLERGEGQSNQGWTLEAHGGQLRGPHSRGAPDLTWPRFSSRERHNALAGLRSPCFPIHHRFWVVVSLRASTNIFYQVKGKYRKFMTAVLKAT